MTVLEVDPKAYYQAATNCFDAAAALADSFLYIFAELSGCSSMAGVDQDGQQWASSYNSSADEAVAFFQDVHSTLTAYGSALNDLGFNHAQADSSLKGTPQPERPTDKAVPVFGPFPIPASAGGPGQGIIDSGINIISEIGIPVPDGDTGKLAKAADAWDRLGTIYQNTNARDKITVAASLFESATSADAVQVHTDLKSVETAMGQLLDICKQISQSCTDYKNALKELRDEIKGFLEDLAKELAIDVAVTIGLSLISFGAGALTAVKALDTVRRWAKRIKDGIIAWRARKVAQIKGLADDAIASMARARQTVKDLLERLRSKLGGGVKSPSKPALTQKDLDALSDYTGPGYWDLNQALRSGTMDASQQARVKAIEEALSKLPNYEGRVFRGTDLPQSVLDKYKPGEVVTEDAFTSTSSASSTAFPGNTQFTIISKTGKDVSAYSSTEAAGIVENEVLFPPGVNFQVVSKTFDPNTGKTFIQLIER
ncbi:ADP-ribosyltransferase [Nocardia vinacea]|uniref:ADP-ribosyltransferase n=1 Tax=Nocardia vinacea TaxID=96468 RepID=UPI0033E826FB